MINLAPRFQEYDEAGAMHALVAIDTAVDNHVFATKCGDLAVFLSLRGLDPECLDPEQLDGAARRFESALRVFDERFRVYQYLMKREHPGLPSEHHANRLVEEASQSRLRYLAEKGTRLFSIETSMVVVYEGWRPAGDGTHRSSHSLLHPAGWRGLFSEPATVDSLRVELDHACELLLSKVHAFAVQLREVLPVQVMDKNAAFRFQRRLLNYDAQKSDAVGLASDHFLDFQACNSALECHRDYLRLDDEYLSVLTLKEPPAQTFALMLKGLAELSSPFIVATEWKRHDTAKVRRLIQSKRRHFHNSKSSLAAQLSGGKGAAPDILIDNSAVAMVGHLGACLEEIEVHGRWFGEFSLTVVMHEKDPATLRRAAAQCVKIFAAFDAQLTEERYNRLNAWLAVQAGNAAFNLRRFWLTSTNYADLSVFFSSAAGDLRNAQLGREYLAILETRHGSPYFFNLHVQDVAHTFILGATGSGKSFLLNFLLTHLQKYDALIRIFDLGHSYESLTRLSGGSYLAFGSHDRPFTINPFCLAPTPENLSFLFTFVRVVIESEGYTMSAEDAQDLYEQIENLYQLPPTERRLLTLSNIVHRNLRRQLQPWTQNGPYGSLFDHPEDTLTFSSFQTFDFEGMGKSKRELEALLFYVLHRATAAIDQKPEQFKVFVMDEAWRFFDHPLIKSYMIEGLKTWRKKNAGLILATQSADDLSGSAMLPVLMESCPTQIFLANPRMDRGAYQGAFHLNARETDLIAGLSPKREFLIKRQDHSKVLHLAVGPKEYWIYTNNPPDTQKKRDAFGRYGFEKGLEELALKGLAKENS